jgi:hypothetical protein
MPRLLVICCAFAFPGSLWAGGIDALVRRAESTPRKNEKSQPRCKRDHAKEIVALNLDSVELRPGDIAEVVKCDKLESLSLIGTNVTDDQLKLLVGLKNLRSLRLNQTAVSDAGLTHVVQIKSLKYVCLGGVDATPEGVRQLKRALPGLRLGYSRRPRLSSARPVRDGTVPGPR